MTDQAQEAYWQKVRYRAWNDPVVQAYVLPKLDLIEKVLPLAGRSILDVGCGPGVFTYYLKERSKHVMGTDCSQTMLQQISGIETVLADACALPFGDGSYDVAFEANLLHHTDQPHRVLKEMARIAREAVVVIEPNRLNPLMFGFSLVTAAERRGLRFSRRYVNELLAQTGLQATAFWTTGMISQNNTPRLLLPFLKHFNRDFAFGEYHVAISQKPGYYLRP